MLSFAGRRRTRFTELSSSTGELVRERSRSHYELSRSEPQRVLLQVRRDREGSARGCRGDVRRVSPDYNGDGAYKVVGDLYFLHYPFLSISKLVLIFCCSSQSHFMVGIAYRAPQKCLIPKP